MASMRQRLAKGGEKVLEEVDVTVEDVSSDEIESEDEVSPHLASRQ